MNNSKCIQDFKDKLNRLTKLENKPYDYLILNQFINDLNKNIIKHKIKDIEKSGFLSDSDAIGIGLGPSNVESAKREELISKFGEIISFLQEENSVNSSKGSSPIDNIKIIIERFHQVTCVLKSRYSNRATLKINDEYDVQDLFHALLKLFFDDIRKEEYTPSYAGSASRVDFLIKQEKIVVEIKKTRKGLGAKELGEQLIIDSLRYKSHPDCKQLICFVYDPENRVANPVGIEKDLTQVINDVPIKVFIRPIF